MLDTFFLIIDLRKLCDRLSANGCEWTNDDAVDWLLANEFSMSRTGWYGPAASMNLLEPTEILMSMRAFFDPNGKADEAG